MTGAQYSFNVTYSILPETVYSLYPVIQSSVQIPNLQSGTNYSIQIVTVGVLGYQSDPISISLYTKPERIPSANVTVRNNKSTNFLEVLWVPPPGNVELYVISLISTDSSYAAQWNQSKSDPPVVFRGLLPGREFNVTIQTVSGNLSNTSLPITQATYPSAPGPWISYSSTTTSISLNWTQPQNMTGTQYSFNVTYSNSSGTVYSLNPGNQSSVQIPNLQSGTNYSIQIVTVGVLGYQSDPISISLYTKPERIPSANVTVRNNKSTNFLEVLWVPPPGNVELYVVSLISTDSSYVAQWNQSKSAPPVVFRGLLPGREFNVTIQTVSGNLSNTSLPITQATYPSAPGPWISYSSTTTSISLNWTQPQNMTGAQYSFNVTYSISPITVYSLNPGNQSSVQIPNLQSGTNYSIQIVTVGVLGYQSDPISISLYTNPERIPSANVTVRNNKSTNFLEVLWVPPPGNVELYVISLISTDSSYAAQWNQSKSDPPVVFRDLLPGREFNVTIQTVSGNLSNTSLPITQATYPSAPGPWISYSSTTTSISLNWTQPQNMTGAQYSFNVTYSMSPGTVYSLYPGNQSSVQIPNLQSGTNYSIQIVTVGVLGYQSDPISISLYTKPERISSANVTVRNNKSTNFLEVLWVPPPGNVELYVVSLISTDTLYAAQWNQSKSDPPVVFRGLLPGREFNVTIQTVSGNLSNTSLPITQATYPSAPGSWISYSSTTTSISLNWTQPQNMTGAQYSFNVTYSISPGTVYSLYPGNQSSVQIPNLQSGTNYSIRIVTVGVLGYQSDPISISLYTNPERIPSANVTVRNNKSTNFLEVLWVPPPGNVELYVVSLISTDSSYAAQWNQSKSAPPVVFRGLLPGREFNVTIQTVSGNLSNTSLPITQATYPSAPGPWISYSSTTTSISLNWTQPQNMTGTQYSFNVTYSNSSGTVYSLNPGNQSSVQIPNLQSGTNYSIQIVTVGVLGYQSDPISISLYTNPERIPSANVTVRNNKSTNFLEVLWVPPLGNVELYVVSLISTDTSYAAQWNQSTSDPPVVFRGLLPGREFNVTIQTVSGNLSNTSLPITQATYPSAPGPWISYSSTTTSISLNWTQPQNMTGAQYSFNVTYSISPITVYSLNPGNQSSVQIPNLQSGTNYSIQIVTVGVLGYQSDPISISLYTNPERIPSANVTVRNNKSTNFLEVLWVPPPGNVELYVISLISTDSSYAAQWNQSKSDPPVVFRDLLPGREFNVTIQTVSGNLSNTSLPITQATYPSAPGPWISYSSTTTSISLNWTQPQNMTGAQYSFNVTYSMSPGTVYSLYPGNQSSVQIPNLQSGTNYSIRIVTVGVLGYQSDPISISLYTNPERIPSANVTVRNNKSTNFLEVLWVPPPGNVELYVVSLISTDTSYAAQWNQSKSAPPVVFRGLLPGREFNVTIQTVSGNLSNTSLPITQATYPSAPGPWISYSSTTTSISLNWTQPQNMTGAQYSFNVTYSISPGTVYSLYPGNQSSVQIPNLQSGTNYSIRIVTVGVLGYQSDPISISLYTNPERIPSANVTVRNNKSTNFLEVLWVPPPGNVELYVVSLISTDTSYAAQWNQSKSAPPVVFRGLLPGREFNVTIQTVSGNLSNTSLPITQATYPSAPGPWISYSSTTTSISLNWTQPENMTGAQYSFNVTYSILPGTVYSLNPGNQSSVQIPNLQSGTNYSIQIVTVGVLGYQSDPISISLYTKPERIPSANVTVRNNKSTNFLEVLWVPPPGNVELYVISLISTDSSYVAQWSQSKSAPPVVFRDLLPGREFNVTIQTVSGNLSNTSLPITQATYPSAPGPWISYSSTTTSISLNWTQPENMTGAQYSFNVTYSMSPGTVYSLNPGNQSSVQIPNLQSGTNYSIQIVTVGVLGYQSDPISISLYTNPERIPSANVTVRNNKSTNFLEVLWVPPPGNVELYVVSLISTDSSYAAQWNQNTSAPPVVFRDLLPGREFNVTIQTVSGNLSNTSLPITQATYPSAPGPWISYSSTTTSISLNWTQPQNMTGAQYSFNVTYSISSGTVYSLNPGNQSSVQIPNLQSGTNYSIQIVTVGVLGYQSDPISISLYTNPSAPGPWISYSSTTTSISLNWTQPQNMTGAQYSFNVTYSISPITVYSLNPGNQSSVQIPNLQSGTNYSIQIVTVGVLGYQSDPISISLYTNPERIPSANVTVRNNKSTNFLEVLWVPPPGNVELYVISLISTDSSYAAQWNQSKSDPPVVFRDLLPGREFNVTIQTVSGNLSNTSLPITQATYPSAPGPWISYSSTTTSISLNWTQPQNMTGAQYSFNVTYSMSPGTVYSLYPGNQSSVQIPNLQSGTNYSIQIVTVGVLGYQSDPISISLYTNPERIPSANVTVRNNKSTNFLEVLWVPPPGNVELYVVSLISTDTSYAAQWSQSKSAPPVVFRDLLPGREFNVTIQTVSGNLSNTSLPITQATYPSAPGPWISYSSTTTSISLNWTQPQNMTGTQYSFNVTYSNSSGTVYSLYLGNQSSVQIPNLQSGTNYSIRIVTVGVLGYQSDPISISLYTNPERIPSANVTVRNNKSTNFLEVLWVPPPGNVELYVVSLISTDTSYAAQWNQNTTAPPVVFRGLLPGREFNVTIQTVSGNLSNTSLPITQATYPSAPGPWISYSSTTTSISLNWTQPQNMTGAQYSFNVTYSISPITVYSLNPGNQSSVQIPNLQSGTNYSIQIVTVGVLGYQSDPISISLYTNPSAPGPWISYSSTTTSISLNWTQPQNMTGAQYSFNVTYSISPITVYSLNPGNQSSVQIPNLQSGTNYSIRIVTVGVLGYQSDPISISLYTKPERIPSANVTVRNNKSTNFLEVLWVPPPGNVELYVISLISTDSSYVAQWNQSKSDPPVVFRGLLPGREFNVTIQTVSGNLSNTSLPITQATYPSAPGPWISYSSTTTSISLNWTQPQNMTGAQYSFNVTYSMSPGTVYSLYPGNQSSVQIPNLQSGTNYSIQIVTVGVLGYQSDPISISLYTKPERIPSANVTVRNNKSTNFLEVLWVPPPGNVELYVVSLISTDTSYAAQWNQSKSAPPVVFRGLLPGREFNVTIQTVSGNLSNTSLPITQATYPSAPGPWISYSSTTTSISLNWTQPQNMTGAQYSFNVTYSISSGTVYSLNPGNQSSVQIPNLQSGTNYSIQIVTVGVLGYQSDPISISLYTNPERIPSANVTVRNNKSTNFLEVLWVPPPGNVELYVVSLISTDTSYAAQWNQNTTAPPVVFRGLLPGREFNVTIQTVSGNLSNTSLPITQATYPSAPGPWISYSSTTTSISLNWTQPENMTGAQYSFNVTYSMSPGTVYSLNPGNQSSVQIPNLQSGTNYSIQIVTVGVLGYQSDPISISLYTNPERIPSANVTVRNNKSTNFLEVLWVPPLWECRALCRIPHKSLCPRAMDIIQQYHNQYLPQLDSTPEYDGRTSGTNYSIQIVTVGVLGYQSDPISISLYTKPERIPSANVTVRNNKSTNFLEVLWVPPPGNVELYVVSLINPERIPSANVTVRNNKSTNFLEVLWVPPPGNVELYVVSLINPSAPGSWISYSSTTTSISLNWTQPENMTGAQYSFNVTYSMSPGTVYSLNPGNQSSVQIPNLQSGTNYSIQIVTVGVLGYQSDPISISLYTNPERIPSANVTVRNNKSTNFLEVLWVPPPGNVELYVVSLIRNQSSVQIPNLQSGTNYSIRIVTVGVLGYQSDPISISLYTNPERIASANVTVRNNKSTNFLEVLWVPPPGNVELYVVSLISTDTSYAAQWNQSKSDPPVVFRDLLPGREFNVTIQTVSGNLSNTSLPITQATYPSAPGPWISYSSTTTSISLNWTQPQNMTGAQYSFNVTYSILPETVYSLYPVIQSSVQIPNLQSGTNYSIQIVTVGVLGYQSDPISISLYTNPERIPSANVTVRNNKSTNFLEVLWVPPPGNVELYVVSLISTDTSYAAQWNQSKSAPPVVFRDLLPGREFNVTIQTVSGNLSNTSLPITQATYPSAPGPWISYSSTTTSISLNWTQPENMTGTQYSFNVTYSILPGTVYSLNPGNQSSVQIPNLQSGTNYSIQIVTVGVLGYQSDPISISLYTKPERIPSANVTVRNNKSTNFLEVLWVPPPGNVELYVVSLISTDSSYVAQWNQSKSAPPVVFRGLLPGREFNVTIQTVSGNLSNTSLPITQATYPSAPGPWISYSSTTTSISLNWTQPENMTGTQYSFNVTYSILPGTVYSLNPGNQSSVQIPNLQSGTNYSIQIVTVGVLGYQSDPISISLYTKPERIPSANVTVRNNKSTNFLEVLWVPPPGNVELYVVSLISTDSSYAAQWNQNTSAPPVVFRGLLPGREFNVTIQTVSGNLSNTSLPITQATYPSAPGPWISYSSTTTSISLNWTQPENMTGAQYSFNVTYSISPGTVYSLNPGNESSVQIPNLQSGTNYSIQIVTVGVLGYQSDPISISLYTNPERIPSANVTVRNNKSTNFLEVLWVPPPGNVELYVVSLISTDSSYAAQWNQSKSAPPVVFRGLLPGREFNVTIQTVSGNLSNTSLPITQATYPSAPGPWISYSSTTTSISLNWTQPQNMTGAQYSFNVTYSISSGTVYSLYPGNQSSVQIPNLQSGTNYSIQIVTVGVLGYQSDPISISLYTNPERIPSANVTVRNNKSTNFLEVLWVPPPGNVELYVISLISTDTSYAAQWNQSKSAPPVVFRDLLPGREFNVTIQTVSGNLSNTSLPITQATYPSAPGSWISYSSTTTSISLNWTQPQNMTGAQYSFNVTYSISPGTVYSLYPGNQSSVQIPNLQSGTNYSIQIVTVGVLGYQSDPISIFLYTNPERIPSANVTVRNNKSTNFLEVLWVPPPGNVELYVVSLISTDSSYAAQWNQSKSAPPVVFRGLLPGREFNVTIQTVSGNLSNTSLPITQATYPSAPGPWISYSSTTTSISLNWTQPQNMTGAQYSFNVTYSISPITVYSLNPGNQSSVQIPNLQSGTNYSIQIVTVGVLGYQSDPISISLYTNPERIPSANVTVRNNKSTNFLEVLWVPPPGNVELYVVSLISTDSSYAAQWNQNTTAPPVVFRGLLPGREFNVTIQTVSGNLSNTSLPITQATYPSAPGPWISYSSTTTSISLNWTQPQNMTGAQYSFNVTYSNSSGTVYSLNPGNQSSVQIPNLQSGTNYSIQIVTVGVLGYQSDPISISLYTNPERIPSANVTVRNNKSTNFLEVLWVPPPGNVELYVVSLISTDTSYAAQWNQNTSAPPVVFRDLLPGREFNVTIQTVSGNLSNTSLPITQATYPSAPGPWISNSSTTTSISLSWTQPQDMTGAQYSFNVTYSILPGTVHSLYLGNQSSVQIPNLQSGTNYSIQIVTVGVLGYQSDPISISLYTIPTPGAPASVPSSSLSPTEISYTFSAFSSIPGLIKAYAVIVTTDSNGKF
eukprot:XP_017945716.1 PREDICTED: tenascin-X-like [Xenopus tropicalis]